MFMPMLVFKLPMWNLNVRPWTRINRRRFYNKRKPKQTQINHWESIIHNRSQKSMREKERELRKEERICRVSINFGSNLLRIKEVVHCEYFYSLYFYLILMLCLFLLWNKFHMVPRMDSVVWFHPINLFFGFIEIYFYVLCFILNWYVLAYFIHVWFYIVEIEKSTIWIGLT